MNTVEKVVTSKKIRNPLNTNSKEVQQPARGKPRSPFNKITYERNAQVYKVLAHPTRLEILNILKSSSSTVEALLEIMPITKANISQHLALLRHAGVVTTEKTGLYVTYSIVDPKIVEPCAILRDLRKDPR